MATYNVERRATVATDEFYPSIRGSGYLVEIWRNAAGQLDRDDGPAVTVTCPKTKSTLAQTWYKNGLIHREGSHPAHIDNMNDFGFKNTTYEWYRNGQLSNSNGPALIRERFGTAGAYPFRWIEAWFLKGKEHRRGGPSGVHIDVDSGVIVDESWKRDGEFHRADGPASIIRDEFSGEIIEQGFFLKGVRLDPSQPASPYP